MDKQEYKRAMIALFEEGRYKFDDTHIEKLMALDEVALARKLADDADWFDQTKVVYEPKKTDARGVGARSQSIRSADQNITQDDYCFEKH